MYIGGDTDTLAAIAGAIAEAMWGIPEVIVKQAEPFVGEDINAVLSAFQDKVRR